jgi:hypothetical protein
MKASYVSNEVYLVTRVSGGAMFPYTEVALLPAYHHFKGGCMIEYCT